MAWVKVQTKTGNILTMPETVYESMYKGNEFYSLLQEPKPSPKFENKKQEEVVDNGVQKPKFNEDSNFGKSTKKTVQ